MKLFRHATIEESEINRLSLELQAQGMSPEQADSEARKSCAGEVYLNDKYQVILRRDMDFPDNWPSMIYLSIKRLDKEPIHDWRDLQEIKNMLVGPEHEAVELYPAESRLVDEANQYHLWALKTEGFRFPFGFTERKVEDKNICGAKQRPRS